MIIFSCETSDCSAKIKIPYDNSKNFKCPKCSRKYDADEGKNIFFQEELDKFLQENLYQEDYLEVKLAIENDLNAFISWQTIVETHLASCKKKVSTAEFIVNVKEFGKELNKIKFQIPEPLTLSKVRENRKKEPNEPIHLAHEILLWEADYMYNLDKGLGKDPSSVGHNVWIEENKKIQDEISWRISFLKDLHSKFDLNEHRSKFKAVPSKKYGGIFEIEKK
ncbi:MAG: hypothetical protein EVA76_01595 [Candidatus Pelagibacterales bacterium]|nr:MAG: hypothetical protein EVA76_01595 [Pelagibacterales bacterium]